MITNKCLWDRKRLPKQDRMVVGTCLAALMSVTAFGQYQEKLDPAASVHRATTALKKNYTAASVSALPGLQCKLYPNGSAPSAGVKVFTDDDGYARFHAVRPAADDPVHQLTMD